MSVQLIVYPQNYDGIPNPISTSSTQVVANPTDFTSVTTANSVSLGSAANIPQAAIDAIQPTITSNTWAYGWATTGSPTDGFNYGIAVFAYSALLQKFGNLVVNGVYDLDINWLLNAGSTVTVSIFNGTVLTSQTSLTSATSASTQFTAPSVNDTTIVISYNAQLGNEVIESVYASFSASQPSGAIQVLGNGQVICDLYEDEDLPLTLSVDDFKNVAEKVQSYSKAFNLPSTKRNNRIFNAIFEVTRSDDGVIFNAYKKTKCVLKQDGFILFEGYLRLLDVTDKEGEISYNVNLYSEVIALADTLKDRAFRDLDFTELTHAYNKSEIKASWEGSYGSGVTYTNPDTSGFRNASTVKYPFVDWNNQFILADNPAGGAGPTDGNPQLPSLETAFRPFINIKYLVERIFEATPFTFSSDFFNTTNFDDLYMDFNWGADNTPNLTDVNVFDASIDPQATQSFATTSYTNLNLDIWYFPTGSGTQVSFVPPNYNITTNRITSTSSNEQYDISNTYGLRNTSGSNATIECRWLKNSTTEINYTSQVLSPGQVWQWSGNISENLVNAGDTLEAQFRASAGSSIIQFIATSGVSFPNAIFSVNNLNINNNVILQTLRGELGQWDFLKGLITMFNLVTLVDEDNPNNIIIEPYSDVFINNPDSVQLNWTDKIDVSEMKLTPLTDLNKKTIFKFVEDDDDYSFNQYKNLVGGHLYGSKKFNAGNEFNILDGEEEVIAEPFAATVVKHLMDNFPEFITPAIYAMTEDLESEGFENSPRIMYNNGIKSTGASYYIPAQNGLLSENQTNFLQFSHLSELPTVTSNPPALTDTVDFHFGDCQLTQGAGAPTANNLYSMYWSPYYNELYNPNTRIMTLKVNLTPADINTFKFNDTVYIKNRVFRVNKINYKPNDLATVEFILIP
tara:strand:- start:867 stop:3593 length:2727 start_codon:yes stop_codon:yes gene_type:complete